MTMTGGRSLLAIGVIQVEQSFEKGDAFVVPAGFDGTWENLEPARKYYAIFEKVGS